MIERGDFLTTQVTRKVTTYNGNGSATFLVLKSGKHDRHFQFKVIHDERVFSTWQYCVVETAI